jgi:hypothetical protein
MPQIHQQKVSFNSGYLSPNVATRLDLDKAAAGCRVLKNFIPRDSGPIYKRAGFEYLGNTKGDGEACLRPFNYSLNTRFQFELGEGYLRFWNNRAPVILDVGTVSAWSGTTSQYDIGTPVFQSNLLYIAASTHTPAGGNQPPNAVWTTTNIKKWLASTAYVVGDLVMNGGYILYVCTTAHTSGVSIDTTKFTSTGTYDPYWYRTGISYSVGQLVRDPAAASDLRFFRCKVAHTSTDATRPAVGASWTTYWENGNNMTHSTASKAYKKGDCIRVGSSQYICTTDHTSSTSNEPGDVGAPWVLVTGIPAYTGAASRTVGEHFFYGGVIRRVVVNFTSATYLTLNSPINLINVGADWTSTPVYTISSVVSSGANKALYLCVVEHATAATTEPGTDGGTPYWQILQNIYSWATSTDYTAGQFVLQSGVSYLVLLDHTSGTFATDLAANKLVAASYVLELPTPYEAADFKDVNPVTVNDQVQLMHPEYETLLLERFGDTAWRIGSITWEMPPMRDENFDNSITVSASATTGEGITLTASKALFEPEMVGGYFQVTHRRDQSHTKRSLESGLTNATSAVLRLNGRWDIFVYGTAWVGELTLEFSDDGSTNWLPERNWTQPVANMRTISTFGTTTKEVFARLRATTTAGVAASNYAVLEAADSRIKGLVKIKTYQSPTQVLVDVIKDLWATTATTLWAEGAYSDYRGWPRAGTVHEQRLVLIGNNDTSGESEKVRASRFDGFFDFTELSSDDGALAYVAASRESNALMWVESFGRYLVQGSVAGEWVSSSGSEGKLITPTNPPRVELESRSGSSTIHAVLMGEALVFVSNDRQKVYEFSYSFQQNKNVVQDMTQLADDLFYSGIKQIAVVRNPNNLLLCVMNDGRLLSFSYNRGQEVVAWAEHNTQGTFESVSVIYGGELNADEVWVVVKRDIDGEDKRFVESFEVETARFKFEGDVEKLCYLDAAVIFESVSPTDTITGLDHLEGMEVDVLGDGVVYSGLTVSGGQVTLDDEVTKAVAGLSFTSEVQGVWLDLQLQDGSAQDRKQRAAQVTVITHNSNGMERNADPDEDGSTWFGAELGDVSDVNEMVTKPTRFKVTNSARHGYETNLKLRSSKPLPVNILGIIYTNEYFG